MSAPLILRIKVVSYSLLFKLRLLLVKIVRVIPGSWTTLGVPNSEVADVEAWINAQVRKGNSSGSRSPEYAKFGNPGSVLRRNPAPAGLDGVHPELRTERLEFRQPYLATLPSAYMLGPYGSVITADGAILTQSTWSSGLFQQDRIFRLLTFPKPKYLEGSYYTITSPFADNYYHWVIEILPRLFAYDSLSPDRPRLIVNANLRKWQIESLGLLGFPENELVFLDEEYLHLENLYLPSYVGINPITLGWLREALTKSLAKLPVSRRIYITRRRAGRRRLLNESEIESMLRQHDFKIAEMESLTFEQQVNLFSQAEMIISIHGAGLTNMVYAPTGCKVMEIVDPMHLGAMYYMLAETLQHEYYPCTGQTVVDDSLRHGGAHGHDDLTVPVAAFRETLSRMVDGSTL